MLPVPLHWAACRKSEDRRLLRTRSGFAYKAVNDIFNINAAVIKLAFTGNPLPSTIFKGNDIRDFCQSVRTPCPSKSAQASFDIIFIIQSGINFAIFHTELRVQRFRELFEKNCAHAQSHLSFVVRFCSVAEYQHCCQYYIYSLLPLYH